MTVLGPSNSLRIPVIETERLILDSPQERDFEGYAAIVTTDRGRWIGGPFSRERAWLDFAQMAAGWLFRGYGSLSVRQKGGAGAYLGTVLVNHEYGDPEPELGWLLVSAAEGHGYGFEAGGAMKDWAFANTSLQTLVSYMHPQNPRAIALAKRLGGREVGGYKEYVTYRYHALADA